MKYKVLFLSPVLLGFLLLSSSWASEDDPDVEGVFGLSPVPAGTAYAVWVPIEDGQSIAGMRWYNNDADAVFTSILAVAGEADHPEPIETATLIGTDIAGGSLEWSEYEFETPISSATSGLYLVFALPVGGSFNHSGEGGGHGVGYFASSGGVGSWFCAPDEEWLTITTDYQMAVLAVENFDKSLEVLILGRDGVELGSDTESEDTPEILIPQLLTVPNPFNPQATVHFTIPTAASVVVKIFDVRGRWVDTIVGSRYEAGRHSVVWNGADSNGRALASGVYIARLVANNLVMSARMTLVR